MDQMQLFVVSKSEEIRLRVAAVSQRHHRRLLQKAVQRQRKKVVHYQDDMWSDRPLQVVKWVYVRRGGKAGRVAKPRLVIADVFTFAALGQRIKVGNGAAARSIFRAVMTKDGVTRHTSVREQDTDEWAEKERARRARQKPPRPPKQKFKVKGTKTWAAEQRS